MRHVVARSALIGVATMLFLVGAIASAKGATAPKPCSSYEYRQFDFWLGDWEAFDIVTGHKDAHVMVESILDGCVLHEEYDGADGHRGQSFSIYDSSRKIWQQTWVTNRGEVLTIEGNLQGDAMILTGAERDAYGAKKLVRGEWKPTPGGVRETAVTSTDGGKTWQPWFDLIFRARR
jgi:hypothetical protein